MGIAEQWQRVLTSIASRDDATGKVAAIFCDLIVEKCDNGSLSSMELGALIQRVVDALRDEVKN